MESGHSGRNLTEQVLLGTCCDESRCLTIRLKIETQQLQNKQLQQLTQLMFTSILPSAERSPRCFWSPGHRSSAWFPLVCCSGTVQMSGGAHRGDGGQPGCGCRQLLFGVHKNVCSMPVRFTFFSKMRAMVSATAWSSSSTQRTQRNCREEIKNEARAEGLMNVQE